MRALFTTVVVALALLNSACSTAEDTERLPAPKIIAAPPTPPLFPPPRTEPYTPWLDALRACRARGMSDDYCVARYRHLHDQIEDQVLTAQRQADSQRRTDYERGLADAEAEAEQEQKHQPPLVAHEARSRRRPTN